MVLILFSFYIAHMKVLKGPFLLAVRAFLQMDAKSYRIVAPGNVSPIQSVPKSIIRPSYVNGKVPSRLRFIDQKSNHEINAMREAGKLAQKALAVAEAHIKPGITTDAIDTIVHSEIVSYGAYPSPLHYKGFPKSCCTSVNNVACHGVPDDRQLVSGDIVNVDVAVFYEGFHADTSDTFTVGDVDEDGLNLIKVTRESVTRAVGACKPGIPFTIIGEIIEDFIGKTGYSICRRFIGHGIGSYFHGPPNIYHYSSNQADLRMMLPGMTFTIEPIIMEGSPEVILLNDGWTVVSRDDKRSAQAEHTVLINDSGSEVLTQICVNF